VPNERRLVVISAPEPRRLDLIFTEAALAKLRAGYEIVEATAAGIAALPPATLGAARYIIGQPPLDEEVLARLKSLRCIFNVEGNLLDNMPYGSVFARGIHVVTTQAVFAAPVAELGLALALNLARDVIDADAAFREGREVWGLESNRQAKLLGGSEIGLIGYGELGRAVHRVLAGFHARIRVHDPWLPDSVLERAGLEPRDLDSLLASSDFVFVLAAVTSQNEGVLGAQQFARMRPGACLILLSRAGVVDFDALLAAVRSGRIRAASDVFPDEPLAPGHAARAAIPGFIRSAHRAGALDAAFKAMGDMVLDDMALMDRGLPPVRCKRAERETVSMMRSKPVETS
jgi:phosphoglycerate dehydrogenase-like enzyme